jgi:hypothetical protein
VSYLGFTHAPRFNAPTWVAYLLGVIFIGAAARLLEMASGHPGRGNWYATIFFGAFAAVAWWISFYGKGCSGSGPLLGGSVSCRMFAIPAAISTAMALYCARLLLTRNR